MTKTKAKAQTVDHSAQAAVFEAIPLSKLMLSPKNVRKMRIPEDPATYSDNIRPPVPGYPATCDALP